jgi:hypothetical protein
VVVVPSLSRGASRLGPAADREPATAVEEHDMMRLEWNALRVGDKVLVHNQADPGLALRPGTVVIVETRRGSNDVGVSVGDQAHGRRVVRPNRVAVHFDPRDSAEDCWRCDSIVAGAIGVEQLDRLTLTPD